MRALSMPFSARHASATKPVKDHTFTSARFYWIVTEPGRDAIPLAMTSIVLLPISMLLGISTCVYGGPEYLTARVAWSWVRA